METPPQQPDYSTLALAVDGGGTKTALLLFDSRTGATLATAECQGINKFPRNDSHTDGIINEGIAELRRKYPFRTVAHSWLALAGLDWCAKALSVRHPELGCVRVLTDITAVLGLLDRSQPGTIIHAGTGSFAVAWAAPHSASYCGGSGWIIGDPGSGVDLGRRALLALRTEPSSAQQHLARAIENSLSQPAIDIIRDLYRSSAPASILASLAPTVIRCAGEADPLCLAIIRQSVSQLLQQASTLSTDLRLAANRPLYLSGGILNLDPVRQIAIDCIGERPQYGEAIALKKAPVDGVRTLMLDYFQRDISPPTLKRFNVS